MPNLILIIFLFCYIALITYLLFIGKIGPNHFTILFSFTIPYILALFFADRLKELDLRNLRITLNEIRREKRETYAKAESVRKIGEEIAELIAFNVTSVGRFAPEDLDERILNARDKIKRTLTEIGSDSTKIEVISSQIDTTVFNDLKKHVYDEITRITAHVETRMERKDIHNKVKELLIDYDRNSLVEYLKSQAIYFEKELEPLLDRLDKFIKYKTL